ncbi:hypothetical protein TKK_0002533 [Trichogramma kaykai]|uniref:SAM-dependent MTase RsmB/NOP-type domain-containing protein n=1 Tax=Trichogramma kaykai TaxID=54128 RepID=A0ABD2WXW6_9HYME
MECSTKCHRVKLKNEILCELLEDFQKIKINNCSISRAEAEMILNAFIAWLSKTPKNLVYRINTLLCQDQQYVCEKIKKALMQVEKMIDQKILTYQKVPELVIIQCSNNNILNLERYKNEIIVDANCGTALLRGANIYAPGVLGMPRGLNIGDVVSVYADLEHGCKKGAVKEYVKENKLFIGNGKVQMTREEIFNHSNGISNGIAVKMTDVISSVPQLNSEILPTGHVLLQNLPSILCCRALDPQSDEIVLDMCAAPGNKTTQISALMGNKGTIIAMDKIKNKIIKLDETIKKFHTTSVKAFCFNSVNSVSTVSNKSILEGPPFSKDSFDRILLDGPCSALGQRPQISNSISLSQLKSYVPLQKKLFTAAVELLKPRGILVYSTCTITIAENEGIVAWALKKFPNLQLQNVHEIFMNLDVDHFTSTGFEVEGLSTEEANKLCRFGWKDDFVGFFIARFIKKE